MASHCRENALSERDETGESKGSRAHHAVADPDAQKPKKWLVLTAVVAAIVIAAAFLTQLNQPVAPAPETAPPAPVNALTLIAPLGRVSAPFDFQWASPVPDAAYRIEVFDAKGGVVAGRVVRDARVPALDLLGPERMKTPQSYTWKITVFDDKGVYVSTSPLQKFEIAPS
jgi:hypothetical protein